MKLYFEGKYKGKYFLKENTKQRIICTSTLELNILGKNWLTVITNCILWKYKLTVNNDFMIQKALQDF